MAKAEVMAAIRRIRTGNAVQFRNRLLSVNGLSPAFSPDARYPRIIIQFQFQLSALDVSHMGTPAPHVHSRRFSYRVTKKADNWLKSDNGKTLSPEPVCTT